MRIELKLAWARRFGSLSDHFWLHLPGHFWPFGNLLDVRPFHSLTWSTLDCISYDKRRAASRSLEKKESRESAIRPRSCPHANPKILLGIASQDSRASAVGLHFSIIYRTTSGAQLQKARSRNQALKGPFGPDRPPTQTLKFDLDRSAAD